jgi:hypothetical protein
VSRHAQKTSGTIAFRRCPVCYRDVLSAYRGEVTAVGKATILSVARDGSVIGACECGCRVVWERDASSVR